MRFIYYKLLPKRFRSISMYCYRFYFSRSFCDVDKEIKLFNIFLGRKGATAIDIGANVGNWSYVLSRLFNKVIAFEPQTELTRPLHDYGPTNIIINNIALSKQNGELKLHIPLYDNIPYPGCATFRNITGLYTSKIVPVRRLDDYNFTDVDLIKIDVEGYEQDVIDGAAETIISNKPILIVEIEQRYHDYPIENIVNKICKFGYDAYFLFNGERLPFKKFSYEIHQAPFIEALLPDPKRYSNNFLFIPYAKTEIL